MKLAARRRHYLREAFFTLCVARLAVRTIAPARIFAWAERPPRYICRFAGDQAAWVAWAVERASAAPWMKAPCLPRALAAHAMLRRRGIASRLCLGVARDGGAFGAHAWVEVGAAKLVGGGEAEAFTRVAQFGALNVRGETAA